MWWNCLWTIHSFARNLQHRDRYALHYFVFLKLIRFSCAGYLRKTPMLYFTSLWLPCILMCIKHCGFVVQFPRTDWRITICAASVIQVVLASLNLSTLRSHAKTLSILACSQNGTQLVKYSSQRHGLLRMICGEIDKLIFYRKVIASVGIFKDIEFKIRKNWWKVKRQI